MGVRHGKLCVVPPWRGGERLSDTLRAITRFHNPLTAIHLTHPRIVRKCTERFLMPTLPHSDDEMRDLLSFALEMIDHDLKSVPASQLDWKMGRSFSWHAVHITLYRTEQLIRSIEDIAMAGKKGNSRGKFDASSYVFVKCELNAEDKKTAKVWIEENTAELGSKVHDVVASDYKFTLSFSTEHDTFTACLVGKEDNPINGKKTLTARHKDWIVAGMTVLYKHEVIFKSGVWESDAAEDDDGWA